MQALTEQAAVTADQVRAELKRILSSPEFSRSPQLQRFLSFLVNEVLYGRSDRLKEYTLGVEVFARPASYDPRLDSLVRVEAKRLRDLLAQYYEDAGKSDPVLIDLHKGSYVPEFKHREDTQVEPPSGPSVNRLHRPLTVGALAILLVVFGYGAFRLSSHSTPPNRTIAVLPFENLSSDPENEYLCFGLMDEITTDLAKHGSLRVIARTSSTRFKHGDNIATIARQLKADAVMEGSVSKWGDRVRITVQLINASDSVHIWAETYERSGADPLAIQNDVSREIAQSAALRLVPDGSPHAEARRYSNDPEANRLYWKGAYFRAPIGTERWRDTLEKSAAYFRQAIARDNNFALAHSALADVCVTLAYESGGSPGTVEHMACAREAATHVLALDDTMSEAYAVLGTVQFFYDYDHAAANRSFQRALELNPSDARAHMWYALALSPQGRVEEAIAQARQAKELDPLSFSTSNHLASITYFTGRYDEAMRLARETLEMDVRIAPAHAILGMGYEAHRDYEKAIAEYQQALRLAPNHGFITGRLGHAYAMSNHRDQAMQFFTQTNAARESGNFSHVYTAYIYLGLGDPDQVFRELDLAYDRHDPDLPFIGVDPIFEPVRSDPRFAAMMKRLGLAN